MAVKNGVAKAWALPTRGDGNRYTLYDTTAPPAPANPSATTFDDQSIDIDCDASVDSASAVTAYRIHVGTSTGVYDTIILVTNYAQFPYRVSGLDAATQYFFKVTAVNAFGLETALGSCTEVSDTTDAGAGGGGTPLFFDDFDYAVAVGDSGASKTAAFLAHGWTGFRDETTNPGQSSTYFSTVTSIPGFGGSIPTASGRMLRVAALAATEQTQAEGHLQLGSGVAGDIPANSWWQFYLYINHSGSELSEFKTIRNKLLYPLFGTRDGYPMATVDTAWLLDWGNARQEGNTVITAPTPGAVCFRNHAEPSASGNRAYMTDQAGSGSAQQMWPRGLGSENDHWILPNTMYLVKMNMDVSGNPGSHRIWWRTAGQAFGDPRSTWVEGTTSGFTYATTATDRLGAKFLQFPVTTGPTTYGPTSNDYWAYFGNFALTSSEADLPAESGF